MSNSLSEQHQHRIRRHAGLVSRRLGAVAGWVFVALTLVLNSFGIYLGRFLCFKS